MLISEGYRDLNAAMHVASDLFGREGHKYAEDVLRLARGIGTVDLLDYGAGKCTLKEALSLTDLEVKCYDPAVPALSRPPDPADLVVCTDVLEHIEPECLEEVLSDLKRLAKRALYLVVTTKPADKVMPDGTNPHRIIRPASWWHAQFDGAGIETVRMRMIANRKRYEFLGRPAA